MNPYSPFILIICCIYWYTSVEIKPELKKNILKFGYGINYKYEGMLAHSFNRFYVVTKFILPTIEDLKILKTQFQEKIVHIYRKMIKNTPKKLYSTFLDLITYCRNIKPHMNFFKQQIKSLY